MKTPAPEKKTAKPKAAAKPTKTVKSEKPAKTAKAAKPTGSKAAAAAPSTPFDKAFALHQQGELNQAESLYRDILAQDPEHFDVLHFMGVLEHQRGHFAVANIYFEHALALNPNHAKALSHHGNCLRQMGKSQEALNCYQRAIALQPDYAEAMNNCGLALQDLRQFEQALGYFDSALALKPGYFEAHYNRAITLFYLGRLNESLASYDQALTINAKHIGVLNNRGIALRELNRPEEALKSYEAALKISPDNAVTLLNRGNTLRDLNQPLLALASYEHALSIKPDDVEALISKGSTLHVLRRPQEALACYDHAQTLQPTNPHAHWNESLAHLVMGDYAAGWRKYEWRWHPDISKNPLRQFNQARWQGQTSLNGKTILLYAEQGLGDTLQFCRYVALIAKMGARVVLEVDALLKPVLEKLEGVSQLVKRGEELPEFDYHCPLMSLPLAFATELATIPATPSYLDADANHVKAWKKKLGPQERPRVGLVWAGKPSHKNDHNRSIALKTLIPLLSKSLQFFSLQKEINAADRLVLEARKDITSFNGELTDFSDTAALIELMDIVITVDTAVAHLAAAMGKEVWILLPYACDWRWLMDRSDSPWYPSARLFRQSKIGNWDDTIELVKKELKARFK